jgi:hypothetical protein
MAIFSSAAPVYRAQNIHPQLEGTRDSHHTRVGKITLIGVFSNLTCQRLADDDGNIPMPLKIGAC